MRSGFSDSAISFNQSFQFGNGGRDRLYGALCLCNSSITAVITITTAARKPSQNQPVSCAEIRFILDSQSLAIHQVDGDGAAEGAHDRQSPWFFFSRV